LVSSPGSGTGICIGAHESRGEVLLFLHADSTLLPGALGRIREALSIDTEIIGGNFRLVFDGDTPFSRWLTSFYAWIRSIGFYYGDSGIFVRRSVCEALGGFRPIPLMEDLEFVCRLEWFGRTCCIMDPPLITSSRRFEGRRPGKSSSGGSGCTYYSGSAYLLNGWLKFTGRGAAVGDLGGTNQPARPLLKRGANLGGLLTSYSIGTKIECRILPSTCCDRWPLFAPDCRDYPLRGGAGSAHRRGGRRPD
jgi:hypothetical protein